VKPRARVRWPNGHPRSSGNGKPLAPSPALVHINQVTVRTTPEAKADMARLPGTILERLEAIFARLERWPEVSGAKPLTRAWAGHFRIRTGDWRVVFRVEGSVVVIVRIMHRSKVYDD
jgi:mRNA-degrading endonuclease RelE of RelBE toxin-antitoxin system